MTLGREGGGVCANCGKPIEGYTKDVISIICPSCNFVPDLPHVRLFSKAEVAILVKQAFTEGYKLPNDPLDWEDSWKATDTYKWLESQ